MWDVLVLTFISTYALSLFFDFGRAFVEFVFGLPEKPPLPWPKKDEEAVQSRFAGQVCFVIPCHNSEDVIEKTLESLPAGYKVYCVLNNCTDLTMDRIREAKKRLNGDFSDISTNAKGKIRSVIIGALMARKDGYKHFILLDDDVEWPKTTLPSGQVVPMIPKMKVNGPAVHALPVIPVFPTTGLLHAFQTVEYLGMCASKRAQGAWGDVIMASGAAGIYNTDAFLSVCKQHDGEHVGDDLQCSYLYHISGHKIEFGQSMVVKTHPPKTWKDWWRQRAKRWEVSPVANAKLGLKIIFRAPRAPWWIRWIAGYRLAVVVLDLMRLVSFPVVLFKAPLILIGVWAISWVSIAFKAIVYVKYFQDYRPRWNAWLTLGSLLYPGYAVCMWVSRLYALPAAVYRLFKTRQTLRVFVETMEER